jgi:glyoxylase I family protein
VTSQSKTAQPASTTPGNKEQALQETRARRRANIPIMRLHHNAIRTDDMEATRVFYEDILGMPLVNTMKLPVDPSTGKATPYLHCFFEMGDGGMIAFFLTPHRDKAPLLPQDGFDHHFAVKVASFDQLLEIKKRADARNYPTCGMNHNICYSLYMRDPNQMLVEIVADPDNELEINEGAAATAKQHFLAWKNGDYSTNEAEYPEVTFPLQSSSFDEMARVIPADRKRN